MLARLLNKFLTTISAIGISAGSAGAQELTALQCESPSSIQIEAQCACEAALALDTIDALDEFIQEYGEYDTACRALALNALQQLENDPLTSGDREEEQFSRVPGYGG